MYGPQRLAAKAATVIAAFTCFASTAWPAGEQENTTGLPTYLHSAGGTMDAVFRSLPNGQHCISYMSNSADSLTAVEDWYEKQLPNAKVDDINHNSMFGNYFKLDGIKLLVGNDIVNIYRDKERNKTTIELYKCRDAAKPGNR